MKNTKKQMGGFDGEGMRRFLSLAWKMFGSLLLYEMAVWLVMEGWNLATGAEPTARDVLPLTALAGGITAIGVGFWYRKIEQREQTKQIEQAGQTERVSSRGMKIGMKRQNVIWLLLAGFGTCLCLNHLLLLLPIPKAGYQATSELLYQPAIGTQVICTGIVIPFTEELIFRGMAYRSLRRELPFAGAAVISAVYFGLFHGNLIQGIYACLMGIFLAGAYELGGLRDAWIFHGTANLTAIFLTMLDLDRRISSGFGMAVTAVVGGILTAIAFYQMGKDRRTEIPHER